jgi:NAD(P)-dependent dehydrogenase (short-subunit alcohol dehydrogenase family)
MRSLALITGASRGIGRAAALACAEAGFKVIATVREIDRARGLLDDAARRTLEIDIEQLDVTDPAVEERVRELVLKYGPIDNVVNHASVAVHGAFEEQSERDVRDQFETNVFGAMAVTRALLPAMRASGRGRIVNVSGIFGRMGLPRLAPYAASKHALSGLSDALRHELAPFGIHVCLVEAGTFSTALLSSSPRRGEHVTPEGPYGALGRVMRRLLSDANARDEPESWAEDAGRRIAQLLTMSDPPFRTVLGAEARAVAALRQLLPDALFSSGLRRIIRMP